MTTNFKRNFPLRNQERGWSVEGGDLKYAINDNFVGLRTGTLYMWNFICACECVCASVVCVWCVCPRSCVCVPVWVEGGDLKYDINFNFVGLRTGAYLYVEFYICDCVCLRSCVCVCLCELRERTWGMISITISSACCLVCDCKHVVYLYIYAVLCECCVLVRSCLRVWLFLLEMCVLSNAVAHICYCLVLFILFLCEPSCAQRPDCGVHVGKLHDEAVYW